MNRITKAWKALRGTLEPEVRVETRAETRERLVPVGDAFVPVYRVSSKAHKEAMAWHKHNEEMWRIHETHIITMSAYRERVPPKPRPVAPEPPEWQGRIFRSCAEAFQAHGEDAEVEQLNAFVVGDKAYLLWGMTEADIQPKPKRPKGSRA
jgi:hypothetical protein